MDFARRIGKPDEPPTWKRNGPSFVTSKDKPLSTDANSVSEDHRLVNWKKWLAERKKLSRRIESTTSRSQVDQLQSFTNRFRGFVEMKDLMEHAAILMVSDKYRGGPEFWRTPEYLPDRDDICLPQISLAPTRKDRNLLPDLMRVGLPDLITKEQSLTALKSKEGSWKRSEYLKRRKYELAEEIVSLLPKEPEMTTLAIRGRTFRKKQPQRRIPPIIITESDNEEDSRTLTKCHSEEADHAVILKIEDWEFTWERSLSKTQPVNTDPTTWSLTFVSKIDEPAEKEIVLENKGTRVIAYHWRDSSFQSSNMIFEKRDSLFFFNKTKGLVLLGQTVRMKVWYLSRNRGIFTESWRLVTKPKLTSSTFVLRFWGCTIDARLADHRAIDEYLDHCVRDSAIRTIIEKIVSNSKWSDLLEPAYETLLSRDDLFSSQNCKYDAAYNILCCFTNLFKDKSEFVKNNFLIRRDHVVPRITNRQNSIISLQMLENKTSEYGTHTEK
ncbi:MYCBP-associated protein [Ooceraea biroi]|uniref:MYCBP-associated protein n=1 Tax=Ooceraea biroi TaxID=2015173 RepID=A0A026WXW2_OOCBI|nr:MYCBP-associated protein [Ooceraea biroi]